MKINVPTPFSMDDVLTEMGRKTQKDSSGDFIILKTEDKFFLGGGCESYGISAESDDYKAYSDFFSTKGTNPPRNISICSDSPML